MAEDIWYTLEREIKEQVSQKEDGDIWDVLADRLNPAKFRPRRITGCELQCHVTHKGEEYYILTNPAGMYLKLTPPQAFIWETLDGQHTVRDIILAYMTEYGKLALEGVPGALGVFLRKGFLEQPSVDAFEQLSLRFNKPFWGFQLPKKLLGYFMNTTLSLRWVDPLYKWIYRKGGKFLFTFPVQILFVAITLLGMATFGYLIRTRNYNIFITNESLSLGMLTLYASMTLVAVLHESGHALTCVHYGRRVRKGGVMIYIGMVAFYIDTTDIWMAPRRARIAVSWAGPYTNLLCSSLLCIAITFFPGWVLAEVFFKVAAMSAFLAVMNLNPLLSLDGYFIFMDVLEIPNLRNKAFSFLKKNLLHPSRRWLALSRQEKILAAYGLFAGLYTGIMIVLGLRMLITAAYDGLTGLVGARLSSIILLSLGGLLILSLMLTLARKHVNALRSRARAKRHRRAVRQIEPLSRTSLGAGAEEQ